MNICKIKGCGRKRLSLGYCGSHYYRVRKFGNPGDTPIKVVDTSGGCEAKGCENPYWAKGLCRRHDNQLRIMGKVYEHTRFDKRPALIEGYIAKIPLGVNAKDGYAIVDKEDAWVDKYKWCLFKGNRTNKIYAAANIGRKRMLMHRLIMKERSPIYDHEDGNGLNNRKSNLRPATNAENSQNRDKSIKNTSGYKGVSKRSDYGWRAEVKKDYKKYYAGSAKTPELAARMYDRKALELHGEFARLNYPRSDYEQSL